MSSGFITESAAEAIREQRQKDWERVRTENNLPAQEETYDHRSLYERLQAQKQKKELEYQEAHKLKNMIKCLDDDEVEFLELVDRTKVASERKKEIEEKQELEDYRQRVAHIHEKNATEKVQADIVIKKTKPTNSALQKQLKGIVIKKSVPEKRPLENSNQTVPKRAKTESDNVETNEPESSVKVSALKCVAILPGLGQYDDSSSENSSDSENDSSTCDMDLLKHVVNCKPKKEKEENQ